MWTYDLGNFESFTTDNGVTYNRADYEAYYNLRAPKVVEGEEVEQEGEEHNEEGVEEAGEEGTEEQKAE